MAKIEKLEDLEVWQLARQLCRLVYPSTFAPPVAHDFRFKDQVRGTCGSIMDNFAEGFGRSSNKEFVNALTIAKGEAEELKSQLYRGLDIGYFTKTFFEEAYSTVNLLAKKLTTFINYLNLSDIRGNKFKGRTETGTPTKN